MAVSLFEKLYSFRLRHGDEDRIGWSPSKRSKFEVKLFNQVLISPKSRLPQEWCSLCGQQP
jgi:hypothetical protein